MDHPHAYFAGLFDGEGTVGLYAGGNGKKTKSGAKTYWYARLRLVGTYRPMIEAAWRHFAVGQLFAQKRQALSRTPSGEFDTKLCKQGWAWSVTRRNEVVGVLEQLLPFLIEKRDQAEVVLRWHRGELTNEAAAEACRIAKGFQFPNACEPPRRSTEGRCSQNPMVRLSWQQAEEIRRAVKDGEPQHGVVRRLGLSKTMVSRIVLGHTYNTRPQANYSNP